MAHGLIFLGQIVDFFSITVFSIMAFFIGFFLLKWGRIRRQVIGLKSQNQECNFILKERVRLLEKADDEVKVLKEQLEESKEQYASLQVSFAELKARFEEERKHVQEKVLFLTSAKEQLVTSFKAISADTLKETQSSFFDFAKATFEKYHAGIQVEMQQKHVAIHDLVKPLKESLDKVDCKIQELEKTRAGAYAGVVEQLRNLASSQIQLQLETSKLVNALRTPAVRGKWGELQLKRVVEMAGMMEHCDFVLQQTASSDESRLRPDLLVKLPNNRSIIVDAKAPLQAYLEAIEIADDVERAKKLVDHARQLKKHLSDLGDKSYWESFQPSPEFVVLFLPAESFFSVALEHDPSLIEYGVSKKVLLATPTTLIALLKAVAYGWREEVVAEHALFISELGKSLYERLNTMVEHFIKLKRSLDSSIDAYNKTVGSFEGRVLTAARRFEEVGIAEAKTTIPLLEPIDKMTRSLE